MVIRFNKKEDKYRQFSNFSESRIEFDGFVFNSGEATFQQAKTFDREQKEKFTKLSPAECRKLGRKVQLRGDWESVKFDVMCNVVYAKFDQNQDLKELLLSTGDAFIVEDTTGWHDNCWGSCSCSKCVTKSRKNLLGIALMKARARISEQPCIPKFKVDGQEFQLNLDDQEIINWLFTTLDGQKVMNYVCLYAE